MKIVVMSDSHGCNDEIDFVLEKEIDANFYLHCGDICVDQFYYPQLVSVRGNNDYYDYPMQRILDVDKHRIIMFHSHQFPYYKRLEEIVRMAKEHGCDIACYGHTHVPFYEYVDGVHVLNPGSLYYNRDGSGKSYACINLTAAQVDIHIQYIEK